MKTNILIFLIALTTGICSNAQQGNITINQDKNILKLLEIKKDMNKNDSNRYKIQIYSGNRKEAQEAQKAFSTAFEDWTASMQYETPNFKIWTGNFRTRLEADRALKKIKKEFPSAFIFKPKKSN